MEIHLVDLYPINLPMEHALAAAWHTHPKNMFASKKIVVKIAVKI
jgi:hypothetical protein